MTKPFRLAAVLSLGTMALAACNSSTPASPIQVLTGQAALSTFPKNVTDIQALQGNTVVTQAPLAADGTFSLSLLPAKGYRLQFVQADGQVAVVFPRSGGSIGSQFDLRAGGKPFDLGQVRYVGDPAAHNYVFGSTSAPLASSGADENNIECEDGIDLNTGSVCVDDEDEEGAGACGQDETDTDDVECVDGIDPATGLECDGGPAANGDDGTEEGGDEQDAILPTEAAVPDHNLPAAMGCAADGDDVECEDGIDPATGLFCDGGPAANGDDGE